jgi:hypothetical protein
VLGDCLGARRACWETVWEQGGRTGTLGARETVREQESQRQVARGGERGDGVGRVCVSSPRGSEEPAQGAASDTVHSGGEPNRERIVPEVRRH